MMIPDIIENHLDNMNYDSDVWSITVASGISTISVGNVMHLRPGLFVTIGTATVEVISVDYSANSFTVSGDYTGQKVVTFPKLHFFHGTPLATNSKLSGLKDLSKVPMVYLLEVIREELGGQNSRSITASLRLFFLDVANYADWDTDEHYSQAIEPMRNFAEYFLWDVRKSYGKFQAGDRAEILTHAKFGAINNKGHFQSVFNERLSGIELNADFRFKDCQPFKGLNPPKPTGPIEVTQGLESPLEMPVLG